MQPIKLSNGIPFPNLLLCRLRLLFHIQTFLHQQLILLLHKLSAFYFTRNVSQQIEGTNGAAGGVLEAGLDAGGVEEVEAEESRDVVLGGDGIVADGAFSGFAVVLAAGQAGQELFHALMLYFQCVEPHVDDSFVNLSAVYVLGVLADYPGDVVALPLVLLQLKFGLSQSEDVSVSFDGAGDPTASQIDLVFASDQFDLSGGVFNANAVIVAFEEEVDLSVGDFYGGVVEDVVAFEEAPLVNCQVCAFWVVFDCSHVPYYYNQYLNDIDNAPVCECYNQEFFHKSPHLSNLQIFKLTPACKCIIITNQPLLHQQYYLHQPPN